MDRTAWIAVTLCVIGLVLWELYLAKQTPPRRAPVNAPASAVPTLAANPSAPPLATAPATALKPEAAAPSFPEKIETLSNSDVELHLTNRGGGIREAAFLHVAGVSEDAAVFDFHAG